MLEVKGHPNYSVSGRDMKLFNPLSTVFSIASELLTISAPYIKQEKTVGGLNFEFDHWRHGTPLS